MKTRELKTSRGPEDTTDLIAMKSYSTIQQSKPNTVRFNNSDNMKTALSQAHAIPIMKKGAVKDPKDIVNGRFDAGVFSSSIINHSQCHKKGNTATVNGRVFYLK